jgi:DNA mismatch repair protein, C-terminal domain
MRRKASRRSPRKNEKRPVYVLQLSIAPDTVDSLLDPSKRSVYLSVSLLAFAGFKVNGPFRIWSEFKI